MTMTHPGHPEEAASKESGARDVAEPARRPYSDRDRALQYSTLAIDEKFAERWVKTMRDLVARELDSKTFMEAKMQALKIWTRDRKREQHNLNYKFNPARRNPRFVDRDVRRSIADLKAKLASSTVALNEQIERTRGAGLSGADERAGARDHAHALVAVDPADEAQRFRQAPSARAQAAREAQAEARRLKRKAMLREQAAGQQVRSLEGANELAVTSITIDMGVADLTTVSDEEILHHYVEKRGLTAEAAQVWVDMLRPE